MLCRMSLMQFGSGRKLLIDIDQPSAIQRGAGISRLLFQVQLDPCNALMLAAIVGVTAVLACGSA